MNDVEAKKSIIRLPCVLLGLGYTILFASWCFFFFTSKQHSKWHCILCESIAKLLQTMACDFLCRCCQCKYFFFLLRQIFIMQQKPHNHIKSKTFQALSMCVLPFIQSYILNGWRAMKITSRWTQQISLKILKCFSSDTFRLFNSKYSERNDLPFRPIIVGMRVLWSKNDLHILFKSGFMSNTWSRRERLMHTMLGHPIELHFSSIVVYKH